MHILADISTGFFILCHVSFRMEILVPKTKTKNIYFFGFCQVTAEVREDSLGSLLFIHHEAYQGYYESI